MARQPKTYENPTYIASCSFGKDSIATILLAIENNEPLDRVVFAEVMFDHARKISGEHPQHIKWIYETAIPKLNSLGVTVDVVRSSKDYMTLFHTTIKSGKHAGTLRGWVMGGKCVANRDLKIQPIHKYYRQFREQGIIQYVGIAIDEPRRLERLKSKQAFKQVSLLEKYGYTEEMALMKCIDYGLLSPIYETSHRGGCWFCPNCKIHVFAKFREQYPDLWHELQLLDKVENKCSDYFKYTHRFKEVEKLMDEYDKTPTLF